MFLPVVGVYPSNKVITLDKDLLFSFKPLPEDDKISSTIFLFLKNLINNSISSWVRVSGLYVVFFSKFIIDSCSLE